MTLSNWAEVTGSSNKILWSPNIHSVTQSTHLLTLCPHSRPHRLMIQLVKNLPAKQDTTCNAGNVGLIPGSGRSPGERNGNPLQYSCLGNFMDRGTWKATVHGVAKSQTGLSDFTFISLSAIRVVSSAYLRLLIFLPAILILACVSSSSAFLMMYSA